MRGCASTPAPQCWNELAGPTTTWGQRPSHRHLSFWVGGCLRRSRRVVEAPAARRKPSSKLARENVAFGSKALVRLPPLREQPSARHDLNERRLSGTALCAVNGRDGRHAELAWLVPL